MPPVAKWLPAGLFIGNAYGLVIYAMQFIPAAFAVAFTNAGIVIGGVLSITVYREREHWPLRLGAMVVICIGLFLLAMAW
jgi:drug/metabolite transporter (DMT)-like permease